MSRDKITRNRNRAFAALLVLCISMASVWYFSKPTHWNGIHDGMTREHIHTLIGVPANDQYGLKGLETWNSGRLLFSWRMRVMYNSGVARTIDVSASADWLP
ncbi:hypothetical protein [Persicirhabdus sediminis]|uniref:Uncharacterized protein n=1 Tax=Persicirhabdus sediminis TaxID=454144 RepID=A0A8J7MBS4_9BACT|nr:hypothetical protein [Persicirhabdus sediminis]MBK1790197.1 hypothetical protein [Persicirhabdus sediminis]